MWKNSLSDLTDFKPEQNQQGFIQNEESKKICGENIGNDDLGFCLPITNSKTMISFGGKRDFNSISDFLAYIYKYAMVIAGILTVLMIIKGGFSYLISGGNSQQKSAAIKTIGSAVTGLVLAIASYAILNFINPNLTKLTEPQIYMTTTIPLGDEGDYCRTAGPELARCQNKGKPGEYVCRPEYKAGACNFIMAAPAAIAAGLFMFAPSLVGGAEIGGTLITKGAGAIVKTAGKGFMKVQKAAFVTPARNVAEKWAAAKIAWGGKAAAQTSEGFTEKGIDIVAQQIADGVFKKNPSKFGSLVNVAKAAATVPTATALGVVADAAMGGGIIVLAVEIYNYINPSSEPGLAGTCSLNYKLPQGAMCDVSIPQDCQSGKCVEVEDGTGCWVDGLKMGVCSTGENNSICRPEKSTCNKGLKCLETQVWLGTITPDNIYVCSDGKDQSPCGQPSDCNKKPDGTPGECDKYGNLKLCSITSRVGGEGTPCEPEVGGNGGCGPGLVCLTQESESKFYMKCVKPCSRDFKVCGNPDNCKDMTDSMKDGQRKSYYLNNPDSAPWGSWQVFNVDFFCQN